ADRNRSHWSTSKTPSYTKSVSWQHHLAYVIAVFLCSISLLFCIPLYLLYQIKKQAIHITKRVLLLMSQIEHIFVADSLLQTPEPRLMPIS
ncbi:hypothetical protein, partial [Escherichia coli]